MPRAARLLLTALAGAGAVLLALRRRGAASGAARDADGTAPDPPAPLRSVLDVPSEGAGDDPGERLGALYVEQSLDPGA
jgi:hypothetical protein